jgi:hypothetical protein
VHVKSPNATPKIKENAPRNDDDDDID